jgi:hypothetical protein
MSAHLRWCGRSMTYASGAATRSTHKHSLPRLALPQPRRKMLCAEQTSLRLAPTRRSRSCAEHG